MAIEQVSQLLERLKQLGAEHVFCKQLAENDNSKQQIYLGTSFEALGRFPYGEVTAYPALSTPNFKAPLRLYWFNESTAEAAVHTQLIFYPDYPEVRLSGFLKGCALAPSAYMQPPKLSARKGFDGRILVFGISGKGETFAYLAASGSSLSAELAALIASQADKGVLIDLTTPIGSAQNKQRLMQKLSEIHAGNPHAASRLNAQGSKQSYIAPNAGGYTLEALLGIAPNSESAPDYCGWEIKSYSDKGKVTLMTPEPTGGIYGEIGAKDFVKRYGHISAKGMYFSGLHKFGNVNATTGLRLELHGYSLEQPTALSVDGCIALIDPAGALAATWSFASLLTHWNRKHAYAAYVPCSKEDDGRAYSFNSPVILGEETDFSLYLQAIAKSAVVFDPGTSLTIDGGAAVIKARSQFRISISQLTHLYKRLTKVELVS